MQDVLEFLLTVHNNTGMDGSDLVDRMVTIVEDARDTEFKKTLETPAESEGVVFASTMLLVLVNSLKKEWEELR